MKEGFLTEESIEPQNTQESFQSVLDAFAGAEEGMTEIPNTVTFDSIEELQTHMRTMGLSDEEIARQLSGAQE